MHIEVLAPVDGQVLGRMTFRPMNGPLEGHELVRELRGGDCASTIDGLAFVASVVLDPGSAVTEPATSPQVPADANASSTLPGATRVPGREALAPQRNAVTGQPRDHVHLSLGGAMEVATGVGPDPTIIARLFIELEPPTPLSWASARLSFGRGVAHSVNTAVGRAEIALTDGRLEPCVDVRGSLGWSLGACGFVEVGVLDGSGETAAGAVSGSRWLAELGLDVRPTWLVNGWVMLGAMAGAALPLARYRFYFSSPDTTAYQVAAWSAFGEFSLGVRFP